MDGEKKIRKCSFVFPWVSSHLTVMQQKVKSFANEACLNRGVPSTNTCVVLASDPSISQLIDVIGQNQLETLKESAEECLDLQVSKETEKDEPPVTQWEAELKKEVSPAAVKCLVWMELSL